MELLHASGVIRVHGPFDAEDIHAERIPSVLRPERPAPDTADTREQQFHQDLERVLARISRWSHGFFRDQQRTKLLLESSFSVFVGSQLEEAGWVLDLESTVRSGFVDIQLRHPRFLSDPPALIEMKRWDNSDRKDAHDQVTGYHNDSERASQLMAVVVIANLQLSRQEVGKRYRETSLPENIHEVELQQDSGPLTAIFRATAKTGESENIPVTHYVINLRGRTSQRR